MNRISFNEQKQLLINLILDNLNKEINSETKDSFNQLLQIINQYSYENRIQMKGLLSHTIIDSMELDYSIGEKFLKFDDEII